MGEIIPQRLIDRIERLGWNVEAFVKKAIEEKLAKNIQ